MLCQFTVKNYKSIRDEATFDMQAAAISEHEDRIIKDQDGEMHLPVSAIYGPNGGGKSNVLAALHTLVAKILRPLYATGDNEDKVLLQKRIIVEPFVFSDSKNEPTEFELFFRTESAEYRYILHVKRDVVIYESLDRVKLETGRRSALYTRDDKGIVLKGAFAKLKVSDDLSKTLTLLSYLGIAYKGNEVVKDVLNWFEFGVDFLNYGNPIQELRMAISTSEDVKQLMLVIDELDAKIHPVLLRHIIMMFNDMNINRHKAQLIFTSHDLSTMNSEVFRRDGIWFVAKGNAQNSKLYSLVEFKNEKGESVRKDAKFDKQYLEGKYGADPYLRRIIDWGKVNA
ncbi:MAG: AAA family ATPase [Eubacterium sp.]|nr:AAA family ATPase [Eubacterium sp.]MDD7224237.1 AAA family ATPase [Lachnospiraceae bacterium]